MSAIEDILNGHVSEAVILASALVALLVIYFYRKDEESGTYKAIMVLGFIMGILLLITFIGRTQNWNILDKALVYILAFSLIIRPFKDLNLAIVIAIAIQILVYVALGNVDISAINSGWGRIIIAVVVLLLVYGILHLGQQIIQLIGKIFNWYPLLGAVAILCLADAALMLAGQKSIGMYLF